MSSGHFNLRKWYLDCVTDTGDTAIVYCAELSWRRVRLRYSSLLTTQDSVVSCRTSAAAFTAPRVNDDTISVELPKLGVHGSWKRSAAAVQETIFESPAGAVHWDCMQPKSTVRLDIADHGILSGLGYAECLSLTLPPWQLPLRRLRWGRYLSTTDSAVWIDWQGEHCFRFALHNGRRSSPETVSDSEITLDDGVLRLDCGLSLRSGRLGDTVLPGAKNLRKFLPASLSNIEEHKWRSRATLTSPGHTSSGWAIHEVVQWKA